MQMGALPKAPTGIQGLDQITEGGLPQGRPTLICGCAGSGKTLFALEFLVRGATQYEEPGVYMAFEETGEELAQNVASLGFEVNDLIAKKKVIIDHVQIAKGEIREMGDYDLEGIFVRLGYAIDAIGAKRVALDSLETLFVGLTDTAILRAELSRLFHWLKERGVTAVVTAERGDGTLTRHGLEEYVSDCVILLDNRISNQFATRRVRVVKYRGSRHGTDEYPFLIGARGISVMPITSLGLTHGASSERIGTGVPRLDAMLGGKGYYRGSSILVSGTAGTGKTSLSAHLVEATCRRGERCLIFLFEESPSQLLRNMRSIGIDLEPWMRKGLLQLHAARPTLYGLESHLVTMHKVTEEFKPSVVVMDPVTNLSSGGTITEAKSLLTRLIDFFKMQQITALFTSLTLGDTLLESKAVSVSSLMDSWLLLRDVQDGAEHNRLLHLLKSRGMAHSNQCREFLLTDRGVELREVYTGPSGVLLTGSARATLEAQEKAEALVRELGTDGKKRDLERKEHAMEAQIAVLRAEFSVEQAEAMRMIVEAETSAAVLGGNRVQMGRLRQSDAGVTRPAAKHDQGHAA